MRQIRTKYKYNAEIQEAEAILIKTPLDLAKYHSELVKYTAEELRLAIIALSKDKIGRTFANIVAHTCKTQLVYAAIVRAHAEFGDSSNIMHVSLVLDKMLNERKHDMLHLIEENRTIFANQNAGYGDFELSKQLNSSIEILSDFQISDEELHAFVWNLISPDIANGAMNIILYRNKIYAGNLTTQSHAYLENRYRIPRDLGLKLIFDPNSNVNEYGIDHLKLSNVYQGEFPPFMPSKSDLDMLETKIKEWTKQLRKV